jgi:hypothetical protein
MLCTSMTYCYVHFNCTRNENKPLIKYDHLILLHYEVVGCPLIRGIIKLTQNFKYIVMLKTNMSKTCTFHQQHTMKNSKSTGCRHVCQMYIDIFTILFYHRNMQNVQQQYIKYCTKMPKM